MVSGQWSVVSGQSNPLSTLHSPLATGHWPLATLAPSPAPHSGISLMEVLISIGILSIGLLGVAALIPIGKLAMIETNKSDRTGACGRAALRDVRVRRMLDSANWCNIPIPIPSVLALDPLYYAANTTIRDTNLAPNLGGAATAPVIQRFTFVPLMLLTADNTAAAVQAKQLVADQIFVAQDELVFVLPKDMSPPQTGDRPVSVAGQNTGAFSWFLTVAPQNVGGTLTGAYTVSAVVCHRRVLTQTGTQPDGERVVSLVTCDNGTSYGGVGVHVANDVISGTPPLKNNEWVLLCSTAANGQCTWYRVVHAGYDTNSTTSYINLVGPDWYGGTAANIVIVGGVTGVYTTTVQLN